jgi:hypothetical protein
MKPERAPFEHPMSRRRFAQSVGLGALGAAVGAPVIGLTPAQAFKQIEASMTSATTPEEVAEALLLRDREQEVRRRLTEVVYGVVCLCSDDSPTADYTSIWQIAKGLGIPWTFVTITGPANYKGEPYPSGIGTSGHLTWQQLKAMRDWGADVISHSCTHKEPASFIEFIYEVIHSAEVLEAGDGKTCQFNVDGFTAPGGWNGTYRFDEPSKIDPPAAVGPYFRSRYALMTSYVHEDADPQVLAVPTARKYGIARIAELSTWTKSEVQGLVRAAQIQSGLVSCFMHTTELGGAGKQTLAQVKETLEWLAAERDAGRVTFMTVVAAHHASPNDLGPENVLPEFDMKLCTPPSGFSNGWLTSGSPVIIEAKGQEGELPPGEGRSLLIQRSSDEAAVVYYSARDLRSMRIAFDARYARGQANSSRARFIVRGTTGGASWSEGTAPKGKLVTVQNMQAITGEGEGPPWPNLATKWQKYRFQVNQDPQSWITRFWPYIQYPNGSGVEYANISVYKQ